MNTKNDSHDSEKANKTDVGNACQGQGDVNKYEINDGNNDVYINVEHSQQLHIVETETVCKTVNRLTLL